ncbi:hypothetical protein SAMN06297129_1469 [Pseudooceanicola antarcticus]|uniref:Uncharacterized protein n=1 Tax=Pseudooceanicola antarcticus TaxID=1247613 RepID=A0A285IKK5_9RHOB|nr:hypothetical protein SAMN06297129_1469 [Pseudooceanicola antarcticus]
MRELALRAQRPASTSATGGHTFGKLNATGRARIFGGQA